MTVVVKSAGDRAPVGEIRQALRALDPDRPVAPPRGMDEILIESTGPRRFPMLLLGAFAAVALVLAIIGVVGVVSFLVTQRTREIGIRMALGARHGQLVGMIVRRSFVPIGAGLVAGVAGALGSSRLLASFLFNVEPTDPAVLSAAAALLGASGVCAALVPARRAAAVDPIVVLKEE
jgi:putative ABC transport system permease protein